MKACGRSGWAAVSGAIAAALLVCGSSVAAAPSSRPASEATWPAGSIDAEQYTIEVVTTPVPVGQAATFQVKVAAKAGYKFNEAFPTKLALGDPPDGLVFAKRSLVKEDGELTANGKNFTFAVPVQATRAGRFAFEAVLKFSVCNDSKCVVQRQTLKTEIVAH